MKQTPTSALRILARLSGAVAEAPAEAVVILGCVVRPGPIPSQALRERLDAGAALYLKGLAPLVVVTGGRAWSGHVEAGVMGGELARRGVPAEAILTESASRNTRENARFTAELLRPHHVRHILLVTQPVHLRRASRAFRLAGLEPRGVFIEGSYQLDSGHLDVALRDVARELGAGVVELCRKLPFARA